MNPAARLLLENKSWVQEKQALDPGYFQRFSMSQRPEFLWIGCSDSRIPPNEITVTSAGELFIHRNIANLIVEDDLNVLSVLQYAVLVLQVPHVIVCGHLGCGGVRAAMTRETSGPLDQWLDNIRGVADRNAAELGALTDENLRWDRLVELNVLAQVEKLARTPVIQTAWARGASPRLHGWVYRLDDGVLRELVTVERPSTAEPPQP
ncbi:MAG: carbonic anhydrase [Nannocystis sp.]|nr:carbonic anhydrase [Nannocystis sp.]MBA3547084.1 carbonic anhydrase [Nannocystis sp.]